MLDECRIGDLLDLPSKISFPMRSCTAERTVTLRGHCRWRFAVTRYTVSLSTKNQIVTSYGLPLRRP